MKSPFQNKYIKSPALKINPNTIQNETVDVNNTYVRPLEVQLVNRDSASMDFLPYQNKQYDNTDLTTYPGGLGQANIWMQGNIHNIDLPVDEPWRISTNVSGINTSTKIGGSVDGITVAARDQYLLWAFMDEPTIAGDESTCEFAGFGFTKIPIATVTAMSSGTRDSSSVLTLSSRGYSFVPGQTCILRANDGSAPIYNWNYCTVLTVTSGTSVTVFLWRASSQYGNTDFSDTTPATCVLVAMDSYFPWNGNTSNSNGSSWQFKDNIYLKRYRLVGQLATIDFTSSIPRCDWWRKADEPVAGYRIGSVAPSIALGDVYDLLRNTAGTTSVSATRGRFLPPWTQGYYEDIGFNIQAVQPVTALVQCVVEFSPGFSTTNYYGVAGGATLATDYFQRDVLASSTTQAYDRWSCTDHLYFDRHAGLRTISSISNTIGASGSVLGQCTVLLSAYFDGGLREYNWTINSVGDPV